MSAVPEEAFPYWDPEGGGNFETPAALVAQREPLSFRESRELVPAVSPGVTRILEQVNAIDLYLENHFAQRVRIATDPIYELFQRVVDGEVSMFEISQANLNILSKRDERWFPIITRAMETPDAKLRDIRLYRICELVVGTKVVDHVLTADVPYVWMLHVLLDEKKIYERFEGVNEANSWNDSRNYGLEFELALARGICLPVQDFTGPVIEARREIVRVRDLPDVPADFAWSVEMLSKRYDSLVREARKNHGMPLVD